MKKILVMIFIILFSSIAYSEDMLDVVYLKDGSKIKGIILENEIGKTIKIETVSGKIKTVKYSAVSKLKKEIKPVKKESMDFEIFKEVKFGGSIYAVTFSPDGKYLAVGNKILETDGFTQIKEIERTEMDNLDLIFSNNGGYLAVSTGTNGRGLIYDTSSWSRISNSDECDEIAFSSDGMIIILNTGNILGVQYDPDNDSSVRTGRGDSRIKWSKHLGVYHYSKFKFSPDENSMIIPDRKEATILNIKSGEEVKKISVGNSIKTDAELTEVNFSPDGSKLVSGCSDGSIQIWDSSTGSITQSLSGHTEGVKSVMFLPDGKHVCSAGWDKVIGVWNINTGKCIKQMEGHTDSIMRISCSPDGKYIASGDKSGQLIIWQKK